MASKDGNYEYPFILIYQSSVDQPQGFSQSCTSQQFNAYTIQEAERMILAAKSQSPMGGFLVHVIRLW